MSLWKRENIWWFEFRYKGTRYRRSTETTSKKKASEREREFRDRLSVGIEDQQKLTLGAAAVSWWNAKAQHLASADMLAYQLKVLMRVLDFETDVADIQTRHVADAITKRRAETTHNKRPPANGTINREIIDLLRPILNYSVKVLGMKLQPINWGDIRLPEPKGRVREFTKAEFARYYDGLPKHYHGLVAFLAMYGVRLREAFFSLSDVDLDAGRITLRDRKGEQGATHTIPLLPDDVDLMRERVQVARAHGLNTVWHREDRQGAFWALRAGSFQSASRVAMIRAGIDGARPAHDFRHHAGTQAVRRTGNLRAAQRLLGHATIQMTARYAHASEDDVLQSLGGKKRSFGTKSPTNAKERRAKR